MQRFLRITFVICFFLPILGVGVLWWVLMGYHTGYSHGDFNRSENAIWLGHTWVEDNHSPTEWDSLGEGLLARDITHLYIHAGPFESDGTIPETLYPSAQEFLAYMNANFPNLTYYAWLGQLRSQVDLDDEQVRGVMVKTATQMVEQVGFEGIHYNIEPLRTGDEGFINLLRETRLSLPNTQLSIATDEWQPTGLTQRVEEYFGVDIVSYWATEDFEDAMPLVDQVVIMGYDTGLSDADWYKWLLEQQIIYVTKIAQDSGTDVLMGIPAYESASPVETLENGLLGVIQGLTNVRSHPENFAGVAIYPYWEMDDSEWEIYDELW